MSPMAIGMGLTDVKIQGLGTSVATTTTTTPAPTFTPVTSPGACPDDYVDWSAWGTVGAASATPVVFVTATQGVLGTLTNPGGTEIVFHKETVCSGADFAANFNACDYAIATNLTGSPSGEINVQFNEDVSGVSAQVQPVAYGAFVAKLRVYDSGDNLLYTGTNSGTANGDVSPGDNTAPWLGVTSSSPVIRRAIYTLDTAPGGDTLQLAINQLFVCTTPTTTTTTLPPSVWPPSLACPSNVFDYFDWKNDAVYGTPTDSLISPFTAFGANENTACIISRPGMTLFLRFRESPCPGETANGSFDPCDEGIYATNIGSPSVSYVAFQFIHGLTAFGVTIQPDAFGQFTARMRVYDAGTHLLGETTVIGSNNGCVTPGDGVAPFIGMQSDHDNIYRVEVSLDQAAGNTEKFFSIASTYFCAPNDVRTYKISDGSTCTTDHFDWSTKGAAGTALADGFTVTSSVNSVVATVNCNAEGFFVRKENPCSGGDLDSSFAPCDWVLKGLKHPDADPDYRRSGVISITFPSDVGGVVARISPKIDGTYTAYVYAYDADDNEIGNQEFTGNTNDGNASPGSDIAPWVGIGAWENNIRRVEFYVYVDSSSINYPFTTELGNVYFCPVSNTTTTTRTTTTTEAPPAVEYFSDPTGCATDYLDWSTLGAAGSTPGCPNNLLSNSGTVTLWFDNPGAGTWVVHKEQTCSGADYTADFTACDYFLGTVTGSPTPEGWIEVAFSVGVAGVITQIQAKEAGAFTARVHAYDAYGNDLGSVTVSGTSGSAGDGSAPQLGIKTQDGSASIRWVRYTLDSAGGGNLQEFFINRLKFCTSAPS